MGRLIIQLSLSDLMPARQGAMNALSEQPDEGDATQRTVGTLRRGTKSCHRLSFLPIPALIVLMTDVYFTVDRFVFYDPPWLILIGNTLFITLTCMIVSFIAMRNYSATGRIQVLLLGCGVLVFGVGGVLAAAVRSLGIRRIGCRLSGPSLQHAAAIPFFGFR